MYQGNEGDQGKGVEELMLMWLVLRHQGGMADPWASMKPADRPSMVPPPPTVEYMVPQGASVGVGGGQVRRG